MGLVGVYFFLIFFNIGGEFLVNVAGFVIPSYYSLGALFSVGKVDDTQVSYTHHNTRCTTRAHSEPAANVIVVVDGMLIFDVAEVTKPSRMEITDMLR